MSDEERDHLRRRFLAYHETRDLAIRDELVAANLRLALHLARRFANRGVSTDDLEQVASLGLLQAIDRYDPTRGLEFSTFATPTIVGELKRHFRDKGWSVRVPRRVQELHLRISSLVAELTHQLGRSPTIDELATAARASTEEVLEAMEAAQAYRSQPLDTGDGASDRSATAQLGTDDLGLFEAENRVVVESLITQLKPRDQLLVRLRFFDEMTQHQIAERLGISQMHVSRLLARCLDELRWRARTSPR
jgi:RNA polymerase sigma-B factor